MPELDDLPLWATQRGAIQTVRQYLQAPRTGLAALVQMPTGTGKSGVIAALATLFDDTPQVLVVSPFAALRDQIAKDIGTRFWGKMRVPAPEKAVRKLLPSTVLDVLQEPGKPIVYVCTAKTLQTIHDENPSALNELRRRLSLVLFDEGHREPAQSWSAAVEALEKPVALFSATPYRNDHKFLHTDPDYRYTLTHHQALSDRYIRQVHFYEQDFVSTAEDFVDRLLQFYDGEFQRVLHQGASARVIIRCESRGSVMAIHQALQARGRTSLAIHDALQTNHQEETYRAVPSPDEEGAVFWVHQNKLIEGVDDPTFRLLAIYEPLGNARSLVQQVGRIIRNPSRAGGQRAYVFCRPRDGQREYWENYLAYDRHPSTISIADLVKAAQDGYQYFESNFRKAFDASHSEAYKELAYQKSVNILELPDGFSIDKFRSELVSEWYDNNRTDVHAMVPEQDTIVCLYCSFRNSPRLTRRIFLEYELGYTFAYVSGRLLFYYDSQGMTPEYLRKRAGRISPVALQRLFPDGSTISQVSLQNSDLGQHSIRRRSINAQNLLLTAPSLSDQAHVCSTAEGFLSAAGRPPVRRYLGFSRGRISDREHETVSFSDYRAWIRGLDQEIAQPRSRHAHRLFRRFSAVIVPPRNPEPANILLDLDDAAELFRTPQGGQLSVQDTCVDVDGREFTLVANGTPYTVGIKYIPGKKAYSLSSLELDKAYNHNTLGQKNESLLSYLNRLQPFRIVPRSQGCVFSHGHFYSARRVAADLDLGEILIEIPQLEHVSNEKGSPGVARAGWSSDSIFGMVDALGAGTDLSAHMQGITHLVCDDLEKEVADFIALDEATNRVIFIHAKAGSTPGLSASKLADVCGQAVKNLNFLQPSPFDKPGNLQLWDGPWTRDRGADSVTARVRLGRLDGRQFWDKATEILRNPHARREVWIVFGKGLSKGAFDSEKQKQKQRPEFVQVYYELAATWSSVTAVGAKLSVFCSP